MSLALSLQLTGSAGLTGIAPANLLEVQDVNGNTYAWADRAITAPSVLVPGTSVTFLPWLVEVPEIVRYRSLQTGTGQFIVQNVSGTTLSRDMEVLMRASALEGALFAYRSWQAASLDSWIQWSGTLGSATPNETLVTISARDQYDVNVIPANDREICERCPWLWGDRRCGVTQASSGGGDVSVVRGTYTPPLPPLGITGADGAAIRPDFRPVGIDPGDPSGGSPGSPGNPGQPPGTGGGTVTSSTECFYSFDSCQVTDRFGGVVSHYEPNYGEALARMAGNVQVRLRKI